MPDTKFEMPQTSLVVSDQEKVAKEFAYPTMTCPITGTKFKDSDVIKMQCAGSGFAAGGAKQASVYKSVMN